LRNDEGKQSARRFLILLVVMSVAIACIGCEGSTGAAKKNGTTVVDDLGDKVTVPANPQRIMSLASSTTEILSTENYLSILVCASYCDQLILLKDGTIFAAETTETVLSEENIRSVFRVEANVERRGDSGALNVVYLKPCGDEE